MTVTLRSTTYIRSRSMRLEVKRRTEAFTDEVEQATTKAAGVATRATQERLESKRGRRPVAPPRPGRMRSLRTLKWAVVDGAVAIDPKALRRTLPHWMAQEVGTGKGAQVTDPVTGTTRYIKVKSQRGRRIPSTLSFGTGPGGAVVAPNAKLRGQHQLYLTDSLSGSAGLDPQRKLFIRKEIEGMHFVRQGAKTGFGGYRKTVLSAARESFTRRRAL